MFIRNQQTASTRSSICYITLIPGGSFSKESACNQETQVQSLGQEDPMEKEMSTHSSILAWRIHGQRSLVGYSPWGHREMAQTELLNNHPSSCSLALRPLVFFPGDQISKEIQVLLDNVGHHICFQTPSLLMLFPPFLTSPPYQNPAA